MTDERMQDVVAVRGQRLTIGAAAEQLGISKQALSAYVARHDLGWPCPTCGFDPGDRVIQPAGCPVCLVERGDEIEARCHHCGQVIDRPNPRRGKYCTACARDINLSRRRAMHRRRDARIREDAERKNVRWTPAEDAQIYAEGLSAADIAAKLGRTRQAVVNRRRLLERHLQGAL